MGVVLAVEAGLAGALVVWLACSVLLHVVATVGTTDDSPASPTALMAGVTWVGVAGVAGVGVLAAWGALTAGSAGVAGVAAGLCACAAVSLLAGWRRTIWDLEQEDDGADLDTLVQVAAGDGGGQVVRLVVVNNSLSAAEDVTVAVASPDGQILDLEGVSAGSVCGSGGWHLDTIPAGGLEKAVVTDPDVVDLVRQDAVLQQVSWRNPEPGERGHRRGRLLARLAPPVAGVVVGVGVWLAGALT